MKGPRNFVCDGTGKQCVDPRCNKNYCVLDYQEPTYRASPIFSPEQVQKEAEKVARDWFSWGGLLRRRRTPGSLEEAAQLPAVLAEAKRRLVAKRAWELRDFQTETLLGVDAPNTAGTSLSAPSGEVRTLEQKIK